jgi:hypothetical protein
VLARRTTPRTEASRLRAGRSLAGPSCPGAPRLRGQSRSPDRRERAPVRTCAFPSARCRCGPAERGVALRRSSAASEPPKRQRNLCRRRRRRRRRRILIDPLQRYYYYQIEMHITSLLATVSLLLAAVLLICRRRPSSSQKELRRALIWLLPDFRRRLVRDKRLYSQLGTRLSVVRWEVHATTSGWNVWGKMSHGIFSSTVLGLKQSMLIQRSRALQ